MIVLLSISKTVDASVQIFNFDTRNYETLESLSLKLPGNAYYVLGEIHYSDKVQQAQADFISQMVITHNSEQAFDVNWEFLNYKDQNKIQKEFQRYSNNLINVEQFLEIFYQSRGNSYHPILATVKKYKGNFFGVNASRKIKQKLIKNGLGSLSPEDIPPNMEMGSDLYLELFRKAMGGHVNEEQLKAYYLAQCYTDSVMSYYVNFFNVNPLSFLIVGAFHSDFNLGIVNALKKIGRQKTVNLKFVDKSTLSENELRMLLTPTRPFGKVADYLVLID